jgi:OPT family oligopeptide transporter
MSAPTSGESDFSTASGFAPGVPPLPENATPEQKDLHWYKHVYQGDMMPQLTWRAVIMGGFLGMVMSASNLYTTLSVGWSFGVAITACVLSFVIWNFVRFTSGGKLSQMSVLENACMASTASAAGYSTGSAIGVMFGAMVLLYQAPAGTPETEVYTWDITKPWVVAVFTLCTGLMGVFLAIPTKRQMINHEQLPFPSGIAAAETLKSLYSESKDAIIKAYVLVTGLAAGLLIGLLRAADDILDGIGFLKKGFTWFGDKLFNIRIPQDISMASLLGGLYPKGLVPSGFVFEPSALLIAAGMIVGMRISLSMLGSALLLYLVVGPYLSGLDAGNAAVPDYHFNLGVTGGVIALQRWSLWGGTAVMVFASLTSVALQWKTLVKSFRRDKSADAASIGMASIEVPASWMVAGMIPITVAMMWLLMQEFGVVWYAGLIAVAMAFVLSMVGSRATGETDTTPIGAMGKVMQLIFAVLPGTKGLLIPNLVSAGIAANSASASADLLTDLKTGYLLGANPRKQFIAQFAGVFFGTVAVVPIWFLMVPTRAKLETFQLPSTRIWEAVAKALTKGIDYLPASAQKAIVIGAVVGIAFPVVERLLPAKARRFMPSITGVGLAWVMSFQNSFSFFVGAVIALLWTKLHRKSADNYNVPLASGLIAGESLMAAGLAITATVLGIGTMRGWW